MSAELLSLLLDFIVLTALVGTMYYAMRLSRSLDGFRQHRDNMKGLIAELSKNVNDAQTAIEGLKAMSNIAADNLDDVLHDSRRMGEELKLINETSESLANRLENMASQSRKMTQAANGMGSLDDDDFEDEDVYFSEPQAANNDELPDPPSFFIQDRDHGNDDDDAMISEAERELLEALKDNKKSGRR